jgi:hypothetical protein
MRGSIFDDTFMRYALSFEFVILTFKVTGLFLLISRLGYLVKEQITNSLVWTRESIARTVRKSVDTVEHLLLLQEITSCLNLFLRNIAGHKISSLLWNPKNSGIYGSLFWTCTIHSSSHILLFKFPFITIPPFILVSPKWSPYATCFARVH